MDGNTLQQLFSGSNPFLAQMGEAAFNQAQQKEKANLASIMGQEQRAQAMHPLEMESKQASTALNQSNANLNKYALDTKLPKEKALEQVMQKYHKEADDMSREQTRAQILRMMQIAGMAKSNGGALPPGINLKPEEIQQYSPENLDKLIQYGETFLRYDPEEIAKRQRAKEAESLAKIRTDGQIAVKNTPSSGGGGSAPKPAKNPKELMTQYTQLANQAAPGSEEQKRYLEMAGAEWAKIQQEAILRAQAPLGGKVDPVGTANDTTGGVVARPMPQAGPMPSAGNNPVVKPSTGSPAQNKMSLGKLQEMYPGVPPEKLKEAFKKKFGVDVQ